MPPTNRAFHFLSNSFFQAQCSLQNNKKERDGENGDSGDEPPSMECGACGEDAQAAITYGEWVCLMAPHHH